MALKHKVLHLAAGDMIRELEALNDVKFGAESVRIVNEHMKRREDMWIAEVERLERELARIAEFITLPAPTAAGAAEPGNVVRWRVERVGDEQNEAVTVAWAHVEGRYPYRWQEEGGKWHTVTNIVNDGKTDEYEIWFETVDPDAWAVVRRTEKLLRGGAL